MPVVDVDLRRLAALAGWNGPPEGILDVVPYAGLDIESVDGPVARLEYSPNRPDFATEWGIAAYLRGITGVERGPVGLSASRPSITIYVDRALRGVRPYIAGLAAKGLALDEESIRQLIRLQEDLHQGPGRRRRYLAIGLHDLGKLDPPLYYRAVDGDYEFVPLGESRRWRVRDILSGHELGIEYGAALPASGPYPMLVDSAGNTLSFPPIINGERTRVHGGTGALFVDVTGTSYSRVMDALSVLALTLHEMGAALEYTTVDYGDIRLLSPDLSSREIRLSARRASSLLGLELSPPDLGEYLGRARIGVSEVLPDGVVAAVPRYRFDVMHEVDLVEEVAYGYGYARMGPEAPREPGMGAGSGAASFEEAVRDIAVGLGLQEVLTTHLTSYDLLYGVTRRRPERPIRVLSSKSGEHEYLRDSLIPGLLGVLSSNAHEEYPQRIFEVGSAVVAGPGGVEERRELAIATAHARAGFTEMKSIVDAVVGSLTGRRPSYSQAGCPPPFIDGRCASASLDGAVLGILGEIDPATLEPLRIQVPVAAAELSVDALRSACGKRYPPR